MSAASIPVTIERYGSFSGQVAHLDPQHGYVAPPLHGVRAIEYLKTR